MEHVRLWHYYTTGLHWDRRSDADLGVGNGSQSWENPATGTRCETCRKTLYVQPATTCMGDSPKAPTAEPSLVPPG